MSSGPHLSSPTFEHHPDGLGIGHSAPRISWRFTSADDGDSSRSWTQSAYDLEIAEAGSNAGTVHHVKSSGSVLVPWPGKALKSRDAVSVRVRSYGQEGETSATEWSAWASVEAALFSRQDWSATPITSLAKFQAEGATLRPIRFRKTFAYTKDNIKNARLYITSLGVYEAHLNGVRIGDHVLGPGWTSYEHRLNYHTFDVTSLLAEDNVLSVEVGEGWYAGRLGFLNSRHIYGSEIGVLAQLEITPTTGEKTVLTTDETWKCHRSAILTSEFYDGEVYDMREEQKDWKLVRFDDSSWEKVKQLPLPKAELIAPDAPLVRVTEKVQPVEIFKTPSGKTVVDFGQNLVGVVQLRSLAAPSGHQVSLIHTEVLENGEVATRPLRNAKCTDIVISSGDPLTDWSPKFTFHGFRYVQIDGWPGPLAKEDFKALVLHTDMRRRGWFECSNPLVNQLHKNIVWGMRGNFLSIPTDCPQRDERLGWTGDIQVFCPTATFLYDTVGMLSNWLEDVSAEQLAKENGIPGLVVPDILPETWLAIPQAVWHDVTVLTPWDLYTRSGDVQILQRQHRSMKTWVEKGIRRGPNGLWDPEVWQLGDWLDPAAPPDEPGHGRTDGVLVADAYLIKVTSVLAQVSKALGLAEESSHYTNEAERLKAVFQDKYITPHGLVANNTQTAVSLALHFSLFATASQRAVAAASLARLVRASKFCIATGFAGTPVISHALTATGQIQLAYRMLLEKHCPSWLYPVTMGATTVWERWDSMLPDGSVNPGEMTSFNHYALGAVADWLHGTVGGISSTDGWRTVIVRPEPGGKVDRAEVAFDGPYGMVKASWKVQGGDFKLELTIPPNSRAVVKLPGRFNGEKGGGEGGEIEIGSGSHRFSCLFEEEGWPPKPASRPVWGDEDCGCV